MSLVLVDMQDSIASITMNHAAKRNALSDALINEILSALEEFRQQKVRVVILRAQKGTKVWSAGHDVQELPTSHRDPLGWDDPLRKVIRKMETFPAPIIAMIEGGVWGGACEMVFACDIVTAAPNATFAITPAKLGVPYNVTGMLNFLNAASRIIVREMAFTALPIEAERAERLGIINLVVPHEDLERFTYDVARQIARNSPLSIAVMKEQLRILESAHAITPRMFERLQGLRRLVYDSHDYQEGIRAFLEKRKPVFKGE
ncbi:MAG: methylmalonyl-CoA decarboxylase [Candidatus Deferrimicrobiaceae bacterium]